MDIIRQQQDEQDPNIWYAKLGGIATDGLYRLADVTLAEEPAAWLAAHSAEAQAAIDVGVYNEDAAIRKVDFDDLADKIESEIAWLDVTIPMIDSMTAAQVRDTVKRLAQENQRMLRAWRYVLRHL
jgi:hypothetical protein